MNTNTSDEPNGNLNNPIVNPMINPITDPTTNPTPLDDPDTTEARIVNNAA